MFRSMFARLFSMFMAVILAVMGAASVLFYFSIRDQRINARMEELKKEAREIAYLASQTQYAMPNRYLGRENTTDKYIEWKAQSVYQNFGAYIMVVDRQGRLSWNLSTLYQNNPDFTAMLNLEEIFQALYTVLQGQEIQTQADVPGAEGGLMFIVGVPWVQSGQVLGATFIHTPAQIIRAEYADLAWQVGLVTAAAMLTAALAVFFYVKRITRPLTCMAEAAGRMAKGDFEARAPESRVKEIDELAASFNAMAGQLSQLEDSRREFVANVSHELRSPMTSIQGFVEGMADGTIPLEEHGKYLSIVSDEVRRLGKLVTDLLALSRMEKKDAKLNLRDFDICELLRRVLIRRMNDVDRKGIAIDAQFADETLFVTADADRIEQVAVNLIDNAIKFTPQGGQIAIACQDEGGKIAVTVSDNGAGILPQDREHIFERFYTGDKAHTSGKGTGLGLSICQRIMEQHGQSIRLLPAEQGAAFEFTLKKAPVKEDDHP
ncbi:MAG: HAMP domain-containing histidine kinase [Clostridia bacterium]|nr:HAMP domain-containing histidine kinase [Clostridia bacterium]